MKKLVWAAGVLLVLSLVFPNGISLSGLWSNSPVQVVDAKPNATIVQKVANASREDKQRIFDVYTGLKEVLGRDKGVRINTTEKWAEVHAYTLQLAIANPGKYQGLDDAIEAVFSAAIADANTDPTVVNSVTAETQAKLIKACDIVAVSVR